MGTKRTNILGVPEGVIIEKPNKHFRISDKHSIIRELLSGEQTKREIWEKYTGQKQEHGNLLKWMRELGYDDTIKTRKSKLDKVSSNMKKNNSKKETQSGFENFETLQLQKRITELENKLKDADMKAIAYSTMVDIAEKEFNIPIRKKFNTKQ